MCIRDRTETSFSPIMFRQSECCWQGINNLLITETCETSEYSVQRWTYSTETKETGCSEVSSVQHPDTWRWCKRYINYLLLPPSSRSLLWRNRSLLWLWSLVIQSMMLHTLVHYCTSYYIVTVILSLISYWPVRISTIMHQFIMTVPSNNVLLKGTVPSNDHFVKEFRNTVEAFRGWSFSSQWLCIKWVSISNFNSCSLSSRYTDGS